MFDRIDRGRMGGDGCDGSWRDGVVFARGGIDGQERGLIRLIGILVLRGWERETIMGDDEVEAGRQVAAGGIYPRCANRPVHGWLSGAGGLEDMSSFVPTQWLT